MKKDGFLGVYLALCTIAADSQVEQFANSNQSLLRLNPSFAGSNQLIRNQFSFRNALPNQSSARVLYSNSLDGYIAPLQAGIGIGVSMEDQAHSNYKRNVASVSYAQHLRVTDNLIIVPSVQVAAWLSSRRLPVRNVLVDPQRQASSTFNQRGYPSTLFFNAKGELVSVRVGELSRATLEDRLGAVTRRRR